MANWKRYIDAHTPDKIGYVNMDRIVSIITHKDYDQVKHEYTGKEWTRLFTGDIAMAADAMGGAHYEWFVLDAMEPIEHFLDLS